MERCCSAHSTFYKCRARKKDAESSKGASSPYCHTAGAAFGDRKRGFDAVWESAAADSDLQSVRKITASALAFCFPFFGLRFFLQPELIDFDCAFGTNRHHHACAVAERGVHHAAVVLDLGVRHECLDRTGKSAAVYSAHTILADELL